MTTDLGGPGTISTDVVVQADGRIVVGGSVDTDLTLVRNLGGDADVDLSVAKSGAEGVSLGDQASYTVTVANDNAIVPATGVTLHDALTGPGAIVSATSPDGTCTITPTTADCTLGALAPGPRPPSP